jgi:hypothetical protein
VHIEDAPLLPVLLLVDMRLPLLTKRTIAHKLSRLNFAVCQKPQDDPSIVIEMQDIIDKGRDVILFVDRGMHRNARDIFASFLENIVTALIPNPRVVAIDGFQAMRLQPWYGQLKAEFESLSSFQVEDSSSCAFTLGRARRLADLFQALLHQSTPPTGTATDVPAWLWPIFAEDFRQFMSGIDSTAVGQQQLKAVSVGETADLAVGASCDPSLVLSATIVSLLSIWNGPLGDWRDRDVIKGADVFLNLCSQPEQLCRRMFLDPAPQCTAVMLKRVQLARRFERVWNGHANVNFYRHPAQYLLAEWALTVMTLIERCCLA